MKNMFLASDPRAILTLIFLLFMIKILQLIK